MATVANSSEIIAELEKNFSMPSGYLQDNGFQKLSNLDVNDMSKRDLDTVRRTMRRQLETVISKSEVQIAERYRQAAKRRRQYVDPDRLVQPTREAINQALIGARDELLSDNSKISMRARDFIRAHCPC